MARRRYPNWDLAYELYHWNKDRLPDNCRYTMLIAWHKFDSYERNVLVECTKIDLNKLPFTPVKVVWGHLGDTMENLRRIRNHFGYDSDKYQGPDFPVKNYRMRILRAVRREMKIDEKRRKRVRLRIIE